jgi:RND family efflux transporter MFP subunit
MLAGLTARGPEQEGTVGAQAEPKVEHPQSVAWIGRDRAPADSASPTTPASNLPEFLRTGRGRWIAGGILLLIIALVVAAVVRTNAQSKAKAAAAAAAQGTVPLVSTITPAMQPVTSTVTFTGTISARFDMPIGAEGDGGRITAVYVEAGDQVKRGQVLAKLDDSVLRPQVNRLAATLEEARADAALADAEYARAKGVEGAGSFSAEEVERRRAAAVTAAARVKVATAQLAETQAHLNRTFIRAPSDGTVLTRQAEVGQTATAGGDALFRLAAGGEVEMRGQVAEQDLATLTVGQTASVRLTGVPQPFEGKVRLLGAVIDPQTRLGDIRIALQPAPALRPGAFARGEVVVGNAKRPVLPQTAVLSDTNGTYVYIVNSENKVERRSVRVAGTIAQGIVISEGLSGKERVVATAGGFLRPGEQVEVALAK